MGGYASAIGEGLSKIVQPALESLGHGLESVHAVSHTLNLYPESQELAESYLDHYIQPQKQFISSELNKEYELKQPEVTARVPHGSLPGHKQLPNLPSDKMVRVHPKTGDVLSDTPVKMDQIFSDAAAMARENYLGKGDALGITTAAAIAKNHGPAAAEAFSDSMAFILKDTASVKLGKGEFSPTIKYSTFKARAIRAGVPLANADPAWVARTKLEKIVSGFTYATFSPLIAVPHLSSVFNGLFGTDSKTFLQGTAKAMMDGLGRNSDHWASLVQTGVMTETLLREMNTYNKFVSSDRTFNLPNGSILPTLYKLFHQPGFSYLRDQTLISGGVVGKMTAQQLGKDLANQGPTPKLRWQAQQFGLDVGKVIKNNGELDQEDLNRAIFKFVDQHYFLDNTLQRSRLLQSTPIGRTLGMYHSYVTRQSKLMGRAMFRDFKERGPASVVRNLAIGATIFPLMGEGVKTVEETIRGQNAGGDLQQDMEDLSGANGPEAALTAYFEMYGHVGAIGVYSHMIRGSLTHSILSSSGGPFLNAGANLVQDIASAGKKTVQGTGDGLGEDWKPVARDAGYDIPGVSLLSQFLMHRILPKANEDTENDPLRQLYQYMSSDSTEDKTSDDNSKTETNP